MNLSEIQSKTYSLTNTDSTSYPNAKMVVDENIWLHKVVSMINDSQDESDYDDPNHGDYPSLTTPLTLNRDYFISPTENVINIKEVSVSYDGVNYYRATPLDLGATELPDNPASATAASAVLDANFSKTAPQYDVKFNAIFLYPKASQADVDAGGKIFIQWSRDAKDLTTSDLSTGTLVPGFDLAFHPILAYGPAWEFAVANQLPNKNEIAIQLQDYEARLRRQYGSKQKDREMALSANNELTNGFK